MARQQKNQTKQEEVTTKFRVGQEVVFLGFGQEPESNGDLLVPGEVYVIDSVDAAGTEEEAYNVVVENPNFNSKRKESQDNPKSVSFNLFDDEIEAYEGEDADGNAKAEPEAEPESEHTPSADAIEYGDVQKGEEVVVITEDGSEHQGVVKSKTPKTLTLTIEKDGKEATLSIAKETISEILPPEEPEPAPAPKPSTRATAKAEPKAKTGKLVGAASKPAKAKAEPKPPAEKVDEDLTGIILAEEEEDGAILELVSEAGDSICDLAAEMNEEASAADYKLGGILYHVRISKAFRQIKDKAYNVQGGFALYVENELGMGYRKAMNLIDIYAKWNKYGLDSDTVSQIGWTKASIIAASMDKDNANDLVSLAESNTVNNLRDTIKETYAKKGTDTRDVVKRTTFKFRIAEDAGKAVQEYLEMAAQQLGKKDLGDVFEAIVTEWASEHLDISSKAKKQAAAAPATTTGRSAGSARVSGKR